MRGQHRGKRDGYSHDGPCGEPDGLALAAQNVLRRNDMGGWTKAAPELYPHQWSWDSAFIAIGLAHLDTRRAARELETLFAVLLDQLKEDPDLAGALAATVRHVAEVCNELGMKATLNLAVSDSEAMAFARYSTQGPGNSLYFVEDPHAFPGAVVVASERLDGDAGWREVPDRHLLTVERDGASLRPL